MNRLKYFHMTQEVKKEKFFNDRMIRVIVGGCIFYTIIATLYYGSWLLTIFMLLLWWQINTEYIHIVKYTGVNLPTFWIRFVSLLFLITCSLPNLGFSKDLPLKLFIFIFLLGVTGCCFRLIFRGKDENHIAKISDIGASVLGFIYTGIFPSFLILVQQIDYVYAIITCFSISMCDVGAYYGGKFFGKHKLRPEISPKKTIEGSISGLIFSIITAYVLFIPSKTYFLDNPMYAIGLGLICGIFSQFGDLFESLLKRDAGVKDSSHLLLSHGGVLDRIDGYMFVLWAVYFYVKWVILLEF